MSVTLTESHTLYRFFDAAGDLLYVGISDASAWVRGEHRSEKSWWQTVASVTLEQYHSREDLAQAERVAIARENPRHNIMRPLGARTPVRTVRVPDDLWEAAQERAWSRRESVSDVLRAALTAYTAEEKGRDIHE